MVPFIWICRRKLFELEKDYYFQQDGAPSHKYSSMGAYLKEEVPSQWLPRSPDFRQQDFFVLGERIIDKVYRTKPTTGDPLKAEIDRACNEILQEMIHQVSRMDINLNICAE